MSVFLHINQTPYIQWIMIPEIKCVTLEVIKWTDVQFMLLISWGQCNNIAIRKTISEASLQGFEIIVKTTAWHILTC